MVQGKPNVLFITTDHQRADSLFASYGGVVVTPALNRLAAQSCVFRRAYTTSPLCVPARTALATGLYPTRNGVVCNDWKGVSAGDHTPVHQMLSEAGYRVGHAGMQHIQVKPGLRERVPFAMYVDQADYAAYCKSGQAAMPVLPPESQQEVRERVGDTCEKVRYSSVHPSVWEGPLAQFKDRYFTDRAVEFIESAAAEPEPFALFVNIWAPHPPLTVPEPYASLFDPERLELPPNVGVPAAKEPRNRRQGVPAQLAEGVGMEEWRRTWAAHLGLTRLADDCIGRILDALRAAGAYEQTIILFMSDHGDHLGQHRMYQKMEMYEQAIRVPLLIKLPLPVGAGREIEQPVSHLDIVPTLLELLDLPEPQKHQRLDGLSLAPCLRQGEALPDRYVFSQYSGNPSVGDIRRAVIGGRYKYIYDPDAEAELYDLQQDPLEMANLAAEPAAQPVLRELHAELARWGADHGDWVR